MGENLRKEKKGKRILTCKISPERAAELKDEVRTLLRIKFQERAKSMQAEARRLAAAGRGSPGRRRSVDIRSMRRVSKSLGVSTKRNSPTKSPT